MKRAMIITMISVLCCANAFGYETLQKGDKNEAVSELQEALVYMGYLDEEKATGKYNAATEEAVTDFQFMNDLEENGIADSATQEAIFEMLEEIREEDAFWEEDGWEEEDEETERIPLEECAFYPETAGSVDGVEFRIVGCDFPKGYDGEMPMVRLWMIMDNQSGDIVTSSVIADRFEAVQDGESLMQILPENEAFEDKLSSKGILPGVQILTTCGFEMLNDSDIVAFELAADEETFCFEIDPLMTSAMVPEAMPIEPVTDVSWFEPVSAECTEMDGMSYKVADMQVLDGMNWTNEEACKVLRVVYEVSNPTEETHGGKSIYRLFQDGIELSYGHPDESDPDTDILILEEIEPGQTRQIAVSFELYNTSSPVVLYHKDVYDTVYGTVFAF